MMRQIILVLWVYSQTGVAEADDLYELLFKIENPHGPIEGSGDEFGISLVQLGGNLVVGAYRDDTGAENAGAVYVFDREGELITTIHNPTPQSDDWFGFQVAPFGDEIIVSAEQDRTAGGGAAYLYSQDGTLLQTFLNPTPSSGDAFGVEVFGIDGKIVISARNDDTLDTDAGAVYVYERDGTRVADIFSPNASFKGRFGRRPSLLTPDTMVIGAFTEMENGEFVSANAYVFDVEGHHLGTFESPRRDELGLFGARVAVLQENRVVISAFLDGTAGESTGAAYIFDADANLLETVLNPTPARDDWFGRTMIPVGTDQFLIGSVFDDTLDTNAGAAYLFDVDGNLLQTFLPPEPVADGHFGSEFTMLDELIVIGSHFDGGGFTGPGAVYVYAPVKQLVGDYNSDGAVDQADLDLVLLNWGADANTPPTGWTSNLPELLIDQDELDGVLLNWGATRETGVTTTSIPEPTSWLLTILCGLCAATWLGKMSIR